MLIQDEWATDQAGFHSEPQNTKTKSDRVIVINEAVSFPASQNFPQMSKPETPGVEPAFTLVYSGFPGWLGYVRDTGISLSCPQDFLFPIDFELSVRLHTIPEI